MKIPGIGDTLEEADGTRYRVVGVQLHPGVEEEFPERRALYIDLDPVKPRPQVPEAIRRSLEDGGPGGRRTSAEHRYEEALRRGLSDAEAREEGWPTAPREET